MVTVPAAHMPVRTVGAKPPCSRNFGTDCSLRSPAGLQSLTAWHASHPIHQRPPSGAPGTATCLASCIVMSDHAPTLPSSPIAEEMVGPPVHAGHTVPRRLMVEVNKS